MKKEDVKAWIVAISILMVAFIIGNYFGLKLEKTIW